MDSVMIAPLALLAYLAPLALAVAALPVYFGNSGLVERVFQMGRAAAIGGFGLSLLGVAWVAWRGPLLSPTIGIGEVGLSLRLDPLSLFMFWLVSFLGIFLIQFSRNYLDGDERHTVFLGRLYLTIAAVLVFVMAGNLWQLVLGWIATSVTLHQLLVFYSDRPRAIIAARKKFILARAGDVLLVIAALLLAHAFGTVDIGTLKIGLNEALTSGGAPAGVSIAAVLVALTAILKSAMFPVHGWLLEVMETPTPVSALLHAGILNAGIFLVVRFGDLVFLSTPALVLLIVFGGFTAMFASSAMIMQSSVKVSLAYSSAAHMGFMLMLCGFGAHSVAIMHLVAHSFYKAHAFLSSGSIMEYVQNTGSQKLHTTPGPFTLLASLTASLVMFAAIGTALGIDLTKRPGETALGVIFVVAVAHLLVKGSIEEAPLYVIIRTALSAMLVTLAFFALELSSAALLGDTVAVFPPPNTITLAVIVLTVLAFGAVTLLGSLLPAWEKTAVGRAVYVHLKNGLYANALFNRLISPLR